MKTINENNMSITYEKLFTIKKVYGVFQNTTDITIIFEDIINRNTNDTISTEIKGFYYGEPEIENIQKFYGELKAEF